MIRTIKVRLKPTSEQEHKLWQSSGVSRFAYNWALARQKENYENGGKFINDQDLRKEFTIFKQSDDYKWLYETSNNITKQAIKDACNAYKRFFKKESGFPKFKSKRKTRPSFYNDNVKLKIKEDKFLIEKVGWVKASEPHRISSDKYYNPHISFDGKYWYISVGIDITEEKFELTKESIGIDVGIKDLAICSNGQKIKNINKSKRSKKHNKKLRRLQRQVSKKYLKNKNGKEYVKTSNIIKLEKRIRLLNRKIANIRLNHLHQSTTAIVKTKPCRIVMETLNIQDMMKNRHLSKAIAQQSLYSFKAILKYKCENHGIEFIEADKFFPSSKLCSVCGNIKKDLKLSDRIYKCTCCGNEIDRDLQASINLSRYEVS